MSELQRRCRIATALAVADRSSAIGRRKKSVLAGDVDHWMDDCGRWRNRLIVM